MLRKHLYIYFLLALYLINSGCVPLLVGAGAGAGVVWVKGNIEETFPVSVTRVHKAAKAGLKDLNIHILEDRSDNLKSEVNGILADGTKVWIDVESTGPSTAKLSIRVGYLGDKAISLRIRDAIKKHL